MASCNKHPPPPIVVAGVWLIAMAAGLVDAAPGDETTLHTLWWKHLTHLDQHEMIAQACRDFEVRHTNSSFAPVVRGLAAWHRLKTGQTAAAAALFQSMEDVADGPTARPAGEMARRWLTRIDMEQVKAALQSHYRRAIAYPDTLARLLVVSGQSPPPLTDRWDKPWNYRPSGFTRIQATTNQTYTINSPTLGAASDLATALKRPYADTIKLRPIKVLSGKNDPAAIVVFETDGPELRPLLLTAGATVDRITFCHAGETILVLSDGEYWLVLPTPR